MASCEKCWRDARGNPDRYAELVMQRECTPEEQAGPDAERCPVCKRMTLHQHTGECMNCWTLTGVCRFTGATCTGKPEDRHER